MSVTDSGLAEARQLYNLLRQVNQKLDVVESKTKEAQDEVTKLRLNVHDVQLLLSQTASLMRRMGLGEDILRAYYHIQSIITAINSLRTAIFALQVGAGPVGWLALGIAGVSMATVLQPGLFSNELQNGMEAERVF